MTTSAEWERWPVATKEIDCTVKTLRRWASLKIGELIPDDLGGPADWGPPLTKLMNEAADKIERLQAELAHANSLL